MKTTFVIGQSCEIPATQTGVHRVLRIPFGQWPHPDGTTMQVNAATAGKLYRALRAIVSVGKPGPIIYNGHPDADGAPPDDPAEYGRVQDAVVEPNALALVCSLNAGGLALVRSGKRWFSPHWLNMVKDKISNPFELLSVGLTDQPVIRVDAIACSAAGSQPPRKGQNGGPMWDKIRALLKTRGVELAADAGEEVIAGACEAEFGKLTAQANEVPARDAEIVNLKGQLATAQSEATAAKTEAQAKVQALACERKARSGLMLDMALADGRVPPAARAAWESKFDADFDGTVTLLACAKPVMKIASQANDLAGRDPNAVAANERQRQRGELVEKIRREKNCSFQHAWNAAQSVNPDLFK